MWTHTYILAQVDSQESIKKTSNVLPLHSSQLYETGTRERAREQAHHLFCLTMPKSHSEVFILFLNALISFNRFWEKQNKCTFSQIHESSSSCHLVLIICRRKTSAASRETVWSTPCSTFHRWRQPKRMYPSTEKHWSSTCWKISECFYINANFLCNMHGKNECIHNYRGKIFRTQLLLFPGFQGI